MGENSIARSSDHQFVFWGLNIVLLWGALISFRGKEMNDKESLNQENDAKHHQGTSAKCICEHKSWHLPDKILPWRYRRLLKPLMRPHLNTYTKSTPTPCSKYPYTEVSVEQSTCKKNGSGNGKSILQQEAKAKRLLRKERMETREPFRNTQMKDEEFSEGQYRHRQQTPSTNTFEL